MESEKPERCSGAHTKVYANYILTSYPPQRPWICSTCGFEGTDWGSLPQGPSYDELMRKFNGK